MVAARASGRRIGPVLRLSAVAVVVASVAVAAVVSPGYDVHETDQVETSVWVTRDDGQYARVNTDLGEFETVKSVSDPSTVVQSGSRGIVFTQAYGQAWALTGATPADLVDSATTGGSGVAASIPAGTETVQTAGDTIAYLTSTGEVYLGTLPDDDGASSNPYQLDPYAGLPATDDADQATYVADAVALGDDGTVAMYSAAEGAVRTYDIDRGAFDSTVQTVPEPPAADSSVQMAVVAGRWVLSSAADLRVWIEGLSAPVSTGAASGAVLQDGPSSRADVLLADTAGLLSISLADGGVTRLVSSSGTPAAPVVVDGIAHAAWVTLTSGTLWSSDDAQTVPLTVDTSNLDETRSLALAFRSNGDRVVLTETATGMVWLVPDGTLLPLDEWNALSESDQEEGTVQVEDVVEQQPPVAEDDAFGVRAGAVVSLPLLLNDHDPNSKDVLTIVPSSISGMDPSFGDVGLVSDDQEAVIRVAATAGTASFTYTVTDGMATSEPATVTLTVMDDSTQSAPEWCGSAGCVLTWPTPQVSPGGYVAVDVLAGWVDPEGDPIVLEDATVDDPTAPITAVPTADGRVAIRHLDANAGDAVIPITVTVADARGATAQQTLELRVTSSPALVAQPTAVTVGVGETRSVSIDDIVTGGSGSYRLVDAAPSTGLSDTLSVLPSATEGTIAVSSATAGDYTATYTVEDTVTSARQTAVLRVTVDDSARALTAAPLTAFVRAGEDTTVDVLGAVSGAGQRVLMVQEASTDDPALSVSVVDQTYVRVSATTRTEAVGTLGVADIVIADGTGAAVRTQLTVILLPATHGIGPIAAPDAVTVRAGAQVDIPVLANDVTPRGERIMLHPDVVGSGAVGELAFTSGTMLRYVAPTTPGVYTVLYSTYLESDPTRLDSATVTITVLPAGANSAPRPRDQDARVLAGRSVTLTIDTAGIDPDGDVVTLAEVSQPVGGAGVATIGPSGRTIVYRAPATGVDGGQVSFTYTVRDAAGATGTATVRVGVLTGELSDVAPVTYSDNVGVELGSDAAVTVLPLTNDRDPLQGALKIASLRPNAVEGTAEYDRLESLIGEGTDLAAGVVSLLPGDVEGVQSYIYTVESQASFSTAEGMIVVDVSDSPAPDSIQVSDSIITLETRTALETDGIDVVTDHVTWATGAVSDLTLSLWDGAPAGFSVDGWRISGTLPASTTLVPFVLTGVDSSGNEAVGYGFLRIPGLDDMRVQAATGLDPIEVGEEQSIDVALRDRLAVAPSDTIEVRQDASFVVQRANATCTASGDGTITYSAGREAPWSDTCSVAVRVSGQTTWTIVPVLFTIVPKDPQAILGALSRTVAPGTSEQIDLLGQMLSWEGGRVGDVGSLQLTVTYSGSSFIVSQTGTSVTIEARANARPGTRETIQVTSPAYGGLSAPITLVVGAAVPAVPEGAHFSTQCDVSQGSCLVTVVGIAGEHDPFAGAPDAGLTLVGVGTGSSAQCSVATVSMANASQVSVTYPSGPRPTGGECAVTFTVADAQNRTGTGTLTIDVLGYPQTPSSIVTQSYTASSVTMLVNLGPAAQAHPAIDTVALYEGGTKVAAACAPAGPTTYACTVSGLVNGAPHTYTARAVNSVGESLDTSAVTTWAYDAPTVDAVTAVPVYDATRTTQQNGAVALSITADDDVAGFQIVGQAATVTRTGTVTTTQLVLPVGNRTIQVVPLSRFAPPLTGSSQGATASADVVVAGSPYFTTSTADAQAAGTTITVGSPTSVQANYSAQATSVVYAAWRSGTPACTMSPTGTAVVTGAEATSATPTLSGLVANQDYQVRACGSNGYGVTWVDTPSTVFTWVAPSAPTGTSTYAVGTTPAWSGTTASFLSFTAPTWDPKPGFTIYYSYNGGTRTTQFRLSTAATESITAVYCEDTHPNKCGAPAAVTPASSSPPTTVQVTFPTQCYTDGDNLDDLIAVTPAANGAATRSLDGTGDNYVVTFAGTFASLPSLTYAVDRCPVPTPTPDPSVSPSP
ncbi:Ig-like domain-containing protein [Demequina capsici]|uniref:Ig-like domain-containing protein n=1 Tax=Demequina capsici TaxID=3075620 RepID=A0AA96FBY4_9MICO|nr:Ig-like domain-containing protein [Demequina sp. PMTSA13]WNM26918.1 Ig-like domain-containing protein [Demequina sp. PMTSA13]